MNLIKRVYTQLKNATCYSLCGLCRAARTEFAFQIELALSIVLIPLAIWLAPNITAMLLMIAVWVLVMIVELINCAIEAVVDRISTDQHELSGFAKDVASGAVLITIILAAVVWITLLI